MDIDNNKTVPTKTRSKAMVKIALLATVAVTIFITRLAKKALATHVSSGNHKS